MLHMCSGEFATVDLEISSGYLAPDHVEQTYRSPRTEKPKPGYDSIDRGGNDDSGTSCSCHRPANG